MTARILHLHRVEGLDIGIFDQNDNIVAEIGGMAGITEDDAEEMVKRWNQYDELVVAVASEAGRAKFWQITCIVTTVAYFAGFIEHLLKGCTA